MSDPDQRNNVPLTPLTAVAAVDGRYWSTGVALSEYFSEYGLIRKRLVVECEYLIALSETPQVGMRQLTNEEKTILRQLPNIDIKDAEIVKKIEAEGYDDIPATNHDVKAVEYFIKKKLAGTSLKDIAEWTHFALTSEDINSVAYGMALRSALQAAILPALEEIGASLMAIAQDHAATPMLSRTHGQSASPTTFGKEMRVFESRLARQIDQLCGRSVLVKFAGAVGNYNAHSIALPNVDWSSFSKKFIQRLNEGYKIQIELNEITTQIEPHDTYAEMFDNLRRANTILLDFSQDMWRYISDGWVSQKSKEGEIGSSTMPHKVNPIDFENAEGNLGVANALFEHFSRKLPISRMQRDLSDSTVLRTFGTAFGHSLIGYRSLIRGLGKVSVNEKAMLAELQQHPEVLAEAIQTVLRKEGVEVPYEKLKALTRGREVTIEDFAVFIEGLAVGDELKKRLKALRPENYIGLASEIAKGQK
jgi:adenylosuccinate lyase